MRFHLTWFTTATRFALIEHGRNRFAMVLVGLFIPLWTTLAYLAMPDTPAHMRLHATGETLAPRGNELTEISGALNAVTLITGFMMFAATFSGNRFDRRLAMAGYPRTHLVLAKVTALALVSAAVAAYATAVTCLAWTPRQPLSLAAALFCAGLTYGALGVGFGSVLRREVEGMFAIVMTSIIDLALQNPITSSGADNPVVRYLPSYGAMQASTAAGFSTSPVSGYLAIQLTWFAGAALIALVGFRRSTRSTLPVTAHALEPPQGSDDSLVLARRRAVASSASASDPTAPEVLVPEMRANPQPTPAPLAAATTAYRHAATPAWRGRATARALTGEDPVLRSAYRLCRRTTRARDPAIHATIQLAPAVLRPACWALWAAATVLDDLADQPDVKPARRAARVAAWTRALKHDLAVGTSTDPIRYALVDAAGRWRLDLSSLQGAMTRTREDAHGLRFTDWAQWRVWCNEELVPWVDQARQLFEQAGAPMTLRLDRQADYRYFIDGVQLIDTLTDLSTDLAQGHLLLPREAMEPFPGAEADLTQGRWSPAVAALIAELTILARRRVTRPAMTTGMHPGPATVLDTMADLMRLQCDAIDAAGPSLLTRPPHPSVVARARVLLPARLRSALAWSLTPLTVPGIRHAAVVVSDPGPAADGTGLRPPPPHRGGARPPRIAADRMPGHVAIIMDGNGRWAEQRGLPRQDGHRVGAAAAHEMIYGALEIGLRHLTLYTFSTENWKRAPEEVTAILEAMQHELVKGPLRDLDVRKRWSGRPDKLPKDLVHALKCEEHRTRNRTGLTLTVCLDYGGRDEIARTAAALAQAAREGDVDPHLIGPDDFARYLPHPDMPDVDLLWRTGNEQRTSNFLPWHTAYAELYFTRDHWPDIDRRDLWQAIAEYSRRQRRHGAAPASPEHPWPSPHAQSDSRH